MPQVRVAKHSGFCYGVKRAIDMALQAAQENGEVYSYGPLIHNPEAVSDLHSQGITVIDSLDEVSKGVVIIRSHGVSPQVIQDIHDRGLTLVDATCPYVAKVQRSASQLAQACRTVLVVGKAVHPEVVGICGYAGDKALVVASASQIPEHLDGPVGVVIQTTQTKERFDEVVDELTRRGIHFEARNTVCRATRQRQDAASELAGTVDAMVVVGGRNSSNTTQLFNICKQHCPKAYFVETCQELQPQWFEDCQVIGVSAGASTPDDQISAVVCFLESL